MDILDFIINLLNLNDSENLIKKKWNIFTDKNEYLGEKIISFFSSILLIALYLFLIAFTIYIIYYLFFK
ncbi:hypothetical protein C3L50_01865 [Flavobacterium alvei]|uniref:Uncharacterized protein n=1 Tax=Flavobacterium alvei TaxID=2080416 RepID=A0A2S5AGP8_9FLAO|nr:hypothetical protein C3L50_01865 [Flavobacterium alvei]